jgi:predicted homoserine dehydrogenase-like protein
MVSKEADVTVGPILAHLAGRAGVVYTPVDGDQHGLLIGLVRWAQELGLEVLCGGKARDAEYIYHPLGEVVSCSDKWVPVDEAAARSLCPMPLATSEQFVAARRRVLARLPQLGGFDVVEMAIAANATGLLPDVASLHAPVLYTSEIPGVLCPREEGGILQRRGAVDVVTCLRLPNEAGLGGGVFIVVGCENAYSRHILVSKGLIANDSGTAALIYRPYHLCGVETPISILCAGLLAGYMDPVHVRPRVDVVAQAAVDLRAGDVWGSDHDPRFQVLMQPARPLGDDSPLPFHMGNGHRLAVDVPAGAQLTGRMVEAPQGSDLWALRRQQDQQLQRMPTTAD